jgi:hypothetical protein
VIASSTRGFAVLEADTPPGSARMPGSPKIRMEKAQCDDPLVETPSAIGQWRSAQMAPCWPPAARTSAPVCGMRPAARGCLRSVTTAPCGRWRSAQMALAWLLAASTGAFRYGPSRQTQSYELVLTFSGRPPGWRVLSNRKASRLSVLTMVASNAASACGCSIGWGECTQNQCVCALASARWWAAPGVMREGGGFGAECGDPLVPQQGVP